VSAVGAFVCPGRFYGTRQTFAPGASRCFVTGKPSALALSGVEGYALGYVMYKNGQRRRRDTCLAQIEFPEWTEGNRLRHSKFVGLRKDKKPRSVVKEQAGEP
jgi:hypothetical protein